MPSCAPVSALIQSAGKVPRWTRYVSLHRRVNPLPGPRPNCVDRPALAAHPVHLWQRLVENTPLQQTRTKALSFAEGSVHWELKYGYCRRFRAVAARHPRRVRKGPCDAEAFSALGEETETSSIFPTRRRWAIILCLFPCPLPRSDRHRRNVVRPGSVR